MKSHQDLLADHAKAAATRQSAHADEIGGHEAKISKARTAFQRDKEKREAEHVALLRERYASTRRAQLATLSEALREHTSERTFKSASAIAATYVSIHNESLSMLGCEPGLLLGLAFASLLESDDHGTLGPPSAWHSGNQFALLEVVTRSAKTLLHPRPSAATGRALDDLECTIAAALEHPRPGSAESRQDFADLIDVRIQDKEDNDRRREAARQLRKSEEVGAEFALMRRVRGGDLAAAAGRPAGWLERILGYIDPQTAGDLAPHLRETGDRG